MKVLGGSPGESWESGCVSLGRESGGKRPGVPVQGCESGSESRGEGSRGGSSGVGVFGRGF